MQKDMYVEYLSKHLTQEKLAHSIGVAEMASKLALIYSCDETKAYTAGLMHDVAREMDSKRTLEILRQNNYSLIEEDYIVAEVLHGSVATIMLSNELNIKDVAILQAIDRHTTGDKNMTVLDAIIFVADMIEPNRNYPGVQELRALAEKDLFTALLTGIKHTISFLLSNQRVVHPRTINTYNWLVKEGKLLS